LKTFRSLPPAGVLPVTAACVLTYIAVRSIGDLTAASKWTLAGLAVLGSVVLVVGAYIRRVAYFRTPRETYEP
jgi:hypothetical protein